MVARVHGAPIEMASRSEANFTGSVRWSRLVNLTPSWIRPASGTAKNEPAAGFFGILAPKPAQRSGTWPEVCDYFSFSALG